MSSVTEESSRGWNHDLLHQNQVMNKTRLTLCSITLLIFVASALLGQVAQRLQQGFQRADANGDEKISADELGAIPLLKTKLSGAEKDNDGFITFEEFRAELIAGATGKPAPSPAIASPGKLGAGDHTRTITVGELQRRYRIYIPAKYDVTKPMPVVIVFHGGGGNPESMVKLTGMNGKAEQAGFIVAYPFGSGLDPERMLTFNGGECCGYAMHQDIDDVGFTRALLDDLATVANVDANRIFAAGLSNGGIMAHRVASELSDRIAAIAPVGGPLMMEVPNNKRPVSVMHFHGTADEYAPFKGGFGKGFGGNKGVTNFRSVDHTIQSWIKANGCNPKPEALALPDKVADEMKSTRKAWSGGKDGSEVVLIEIEGGGHTWPGMEPPLAALGKSTMDISANDMMWDFFRKHPLKI
jgi:poly(3-hydroxybutyrate) depolymerase